SPAATCPPFQSRANPNRRTGRPACPLPNSMKSLTVVAFAALIWGAAAVAQQSPLTLWYTQPAQLWTDALPVGNGRLGAMVFGGAAHERIQFNESTVWTGEPHDYAHKGASQSLAKIRELLWAGKQKEAE